ncbi:unnamed protein product [Rotaria socialis]|uniref:Small ribosomal subunit protein uS15m n=1 Tax=Rotaria socialis TaxID=392032 RepID=A0A820E182_9BILA|nr:unnamed protein product [Rotaria socialis]CAF3659961.1 unnamed protein product [Rotaria socialis]CAF4239371.1 unnamed protein product [Rotaria socialis]CAF4249665.1 unnamed protein product [Rotaria socialis]
MLTVITKQIVPSSILQSFGKNRANLINGILWIRSISKVSPGIVGKTKRALPAHMYKPKPKWETGDIDPYPNFDTTKILRPGFENSEELKTADDLVKRVFTLEYATRAEIQQYYSDYLVKAVQRHPLDQSSYEVLIAKLTARIRMHIKYGDIDPRRSSRRNVVGKLQTIRNFLLNKLMHADYDVYEWLKKVLRIEHAPENPFITQIDHDDRELERMRLQQQARDAVQVKKDELKLRFAAEKEKFAKEKESLLCEIQRDLEDLQIEIAKHNETRRQRARTIVE